MYYLFKDRSSELSFSLEGASVQVSYFSIFDSSTHETSSFQASFDQVQFREQLNSLATKGNLAISNSMGDSMELSGTPQRSRLTLSSKAPGQSFSISGISYDLNQFLDWVNIIK